MSIEKKIRSTGIICRLWMAYYWLCCRRDLRIQTHLTIQEKIVLMRLARSRAGGTFVEIGSYIGSSACFISRGIKLARRRYHSCLYCVDTWMNDAMSEGKWDTYQAFKTNTSRYSDIIIPLRAKSEEAAANVQEKIDFLFIDGDHSYEGVVVDINSWFPKLASGAVVVFHDFGWAEGVQRAVADFVKPVESIPGQVVDSLYWTVV